MFANRVCLVAAAFLVSTGCAADETCHQAEHVGVFTGDADGELVLTGDRLDEDNLLHVELKSEDETLAIGTVAVTEALESGCSDWSFDGDLDEGDAAGTIEGVLTTTSGDGTWTLDDGRTGTWTWGRR